MQIRIRRIHPGAILPACAHGPAEDAGMDLCAVEDATLEPGVARLVATGLAIEAVSYTHLDVYKRQLLHQGGDWTRKMIRLRFRNGAARPKTGAAHGGLRMLPFERVQHAVMAISFIVLVWTGFALKYPDQWWARPLLLMEGTRSLRSLIHRIAASVFVAVAVTHAISLIVSRKLRAHWMEMLPQVRDGREGLSGFAYNLGLGSVPPARSDHSYIEKAEYWAVVWLSLIHI